MEAALTIEQRYAVPTAGELEFWLYNSFDGSCPPNWGDEAIERVYADWAEEDAQLQDVTDNNSDFWSRVFVTVVVLIVAAYFGMTLQ